ncbi:MAG TPA: hypothetical protein VF796_27345 [Humisphaera sp.]
MLPLVHRIRAACRGFFHGDYPGRMTWREAERLLPRTGRVGGVDPPHRWRLEGATRDYFRIESSRIEARIDRRTGEFTVIEVWTPLHWSLKWAAAAVVSAVACLAYALS